MIYVGRSKSNCHLKTEEDSGRELSSSRQRKTVNPPRGVQSKKKLETRNIFSISRVDLGAGFRLENTRPFTYGCGSDGELIEFHHLTALPAHGKLYAVL